MSTKWVPKSVLAFKHYSRHDFVADLIAGVTVGLVALPLAMAFAIASGMPPQAGLYCAVIAGFLLRIARCPRCGHFFSVRTGGRARNNFTSACMNCGLRLDGSNATDSAQA